MRPHILVAALSLVTGLAHAEDIGSCPPSLRGASIQNASIEAPGFINGPPDRESISGAIIKQVWELSAEEAKSGKYVCVYENGGRVERSIPASSRGCMKTLKHQGGASYGVVAFSCK